MLLAPAVPSVSLASFLPGGQSLWDPQVFTLPILNLSGYGYITHREIKTDVTHTLTLYLHVLIY